MNIPGFSAERALGRTNASYYAMARTSNASGAITVAAPKRPPKIGYIDCKSFPESITCNECNAFGPGTFNCCQLQRADACIINNDPNAASSGGGILNHNLSGVFSSARR